MPGSLDLETSNVTRLALLGSDYRGVNPELLCQVGDEVRAGCAVMRDARRPAIRMVAPRSGIVNSVERGPRRKLIALHIDVDDSLAASEFTPPASLQKQAQRDFMLETGIWSSLRTRPFGNIPDPQAEPAALFVTALDAEPLAPQPAPIIEAFADEFSAAVDALACISSAPLYLCHAPDYKPRFDSASGAIGAVFDGGQRAGLPGVHIQALCPIGFAGGEVWHIGYQEVIALGHLLLHGKPWLQRVLSLGGEAVNKPRCLQVGAGAAIDDLLAGEVGDGPLQLRAGSAVYGRPLEPGQAYLAAGQRQLTVTRRAAGEAPGDDSGVGALIPGDWLEALAPPGIFAVPLMRALQLGDTERARELGALELVEEDVAALSSVCVSSSDYGLLLRRVLDQLEAVR
jgi:Na+-transporting NADH:ubiquinone oxidoreductase subunit A